MGIANPAQSFLTDTVTLCHPQEAVSPAATVWWHLLTSSVTPRKKPKGDVLATRPTKRWRTSRWSWKPRSNRGTPLVRYIDFYFVFCFFALSQAKRAAADKCSALTSHSAWIWSNMTVWLSCWRPGSCNLSCLRQRMEKQVKTYIKALKKSINQERFLIRVAGLEYEVAQKLPHSAPLQENCGPGWERDSGRCGKNTEAQLRTLLKSQVANTFTFWTQENMRILVLC